MKRLTILLLTVSVVVACGGEPRMTETAATYSKHVHKRLRRTIDDKERRKALRALQDRVDRAEAEVALAGIAASKKIRSNPDATQAEIEEILTACAAERKQYLNQIGTLRMEMRKQMSAAEWAEVFGE